MKHFQRCFRRQKKDNFPSLLLIFKDLSQFFLKLHRKIQNEIVYNAALKNAYGQLFNFLLEFGDACMAEHVIKMDCLSFDSRGTLCDGIMPIRDKEKEKELRKTRSSNNFRVEYFDFDKKSRLFDYSQRNPITNEAKIEILNA